MQDIAKYYNPLSFLRKDSRTYVGLIAIATGFYQILYNIHISTIKIVLDLNSATIS